MVVALKNSNFLEFFDGKKYLGSTGGVEAAPRVVLMSSWQNNPKNLQLLEPLVEKLINLGCNYFVCVGSDSERLHDFIDDVILEMSLNESRTIDVSNIMTTWHDTDTNVEAADFFLHATNVSCSLLGVFLDDGDSEDIQLKKTILSLI